MSFQNSYHLAREKYTGLTPLILISAPYFTYDEYGLNANTIEEIRDKMEASYWCK
jgi:hypothetical protein